MLVVCECVSLVVDLLFGGCLYDDWLAFVVIGVMFVCGLIGVCFRCG